MGDVTTSFKAKTIIPGFLAVLTTTVETMDDADTITVTLSDHGMQKFEGVVGFIHTTLNSVVVQEQPTTSVTAGVLTLTIGGSTDNKGRTYYVYGSSLGSTGGSA